MTNIQLHDRELATILAALRCWQRSLATNNEDPMFTDHFDETNPPLTCVEIDALCERINFAGKPGNTMPEKTFDVRASVHEIDSDGSDGAYDLMMDNATAEEIANRLRETLADFGLTNSEGPFRLGIHIAAAGQGDNLPLD